MIVIHISGSPGSGKSTLLESLQSRYVHTIDTDEFISDVGNEQDVANRVNDICREAFANEKKIVVFAGILSPESRVFYEFPEKIMDNVSVILWFIDEPNWILLSRFYGRYVQFKEDQEFWLDVASQQSTIPSSREYLADHQYDAEWHQARDYRFLTVEQIKSEFSLLMSYIREDDHIEMTCHFNQCKNTAMLYDPKTSHIFCSSACARAHVR